MNLDWRSRIPAGYTTQAPAGQRLVKGSDGNYQTYGINPTTGRLEPFYSISSGVLGGPTSPDQGDGEQFFYGYTPDANASNSVPGNYQDVSGWDSFLEKAIPVGLAAIAGGGAMGLDAAGAGAGVGGTAGADTLVGSAGADTLAGETALGGGITAGPTASGIGGGATGTGLSAGTTGAGGISSAGAAGTALAPGYFGAESLYPVLGGASGTIAGATGLGGAGAAGVSAAGATALGRILNGTGGLQDYLSLLGQAAPGVLGYLGSKDQTDSFRQLADQYAGYGAPYRQRLSDLYDNPNAFLSSPQVQAPLQQAASINARALSTGGNPIGSGNAMQAMNDFTANKLFSRLGEEKDRLGGFGGLTQYNAAAPTMASNAIGSQANEYNAIGAGISNVFNPPMTLAQQFAEFRRLSGGGS